jgi:hypothetical protein
MDAAKDDVHPTPMEMDAALLGTLPEERRRALGEHLVRCARCAEAQRVLERSADRFRAEVFPRTVGRIEAAAGSRVSRWWAEARLRWAMLAVPAAAALVLVVGLGTRREGAAPGVEPAISIKGRPALRLFVRRGDQVFTPDDGAALAPGDAVRFVVEPGGHRYVLVASVDGAGKVSVYHPYDGAGSAAVTGAPSVEVPGSIVLDGAPGPERVFALFSDAPLSVAALRPELERMATQHAIRGTAAIAAPGAEQASFLFEKQADDKAPRP